MMSKNKIIIALNICLLLLLSCVNRSAQTTSDNTLKPDQEQVFTLKYKEEKSFYLNLKKGDFTEVFWHDSLERFPALALIAPSGRNLAEDYYASDSLPFVASEDGRYKLTVKFQETEEKTADAKISVSYGNVFKMPKSIKLQQQKKINGYDLKIYNTTGDADLATYLLIEKNGKLVQLLKGGSLIAGGFHFADDPQLFDFPEGKRSTTLMRTTVDKTGEGTPDVAVQFFTGGAHCCTDLHFFELGTDGVRKLKVINGADSDVLATGKKPGGSLILKTNDSNFAYWLTSFAGSPLPGVILTYNNGEFRPDIQLMKKPAPTLAVLKTKAAKAKKEINLSPYDGPEEDGFIYAFWDEMLDLLYSDNETAAWQYFDLVWDKRKAGKEKFKQDFLEHLNESPYWQMIQAERK